MQFTCSLCDYYDRCGYASRVMIRTLFGFKGEAYWKDPDEFVPERFINDSNEIVTPEAFIPFGYGIRSSESKFIE